MFWNTNEVLHEQQGVCQIFNESAKVLNFRGTIGVYGGKNAGRGCFFLWGGDEKVGITCAWQGVLFIAAARVRALAA